MSEFNGNTMGGVAPRTENDAYLTPNALAVAICRKLRGVIGDVDEVVEPSAGGGAFVRASLETWPHALVRACEPNAPCPYTRIQAGDGLEWSQVTWEESTIFDRTGSGPLLIVGNPPFLLAEEHVSLAMARLGHGTAHEPQPRWCCFLLRASFLAGKARVETLHRGMGGLRYVWHIAGRPSFTENGKTDGAEYAAMVWQAGYRGDYSGGWISWR